MVSHDSFSFSVTKDGTLLREVPGAKKLYVLIHGFSSKPASLSRIAHRIATVDADVDIVVPMLPHASLLSSVHSSAIAVAISQEVDRLWNAKQYSQIRLVGHSMGAALARKVAIIAHGEVGYDEEAVGGFRAPFERQLLKALGLTVGNREREQNGAPLTAPLPWATMIDRLVLLAGMNTGWSIDSPLNPLDAFKWNLGSAIGHLWEMFSRSGKGPTIFNIRRGAPFIVQTRMQWLALRRSGRAERIQVVQLLGTKDDFVSPQNDVDRIIDNSDSEFALINVSGCRHGDILGTDGLLGEERISRIVQAIAGSRSDVQRLSVEVDDFFDSPPVKANKSVDMVIFVIHGIRDKGYWTSRIAATVKRLARERGLYRCVESETSSYGYFAMLPFILPWVRRQKVEWLMDRYVEKRAQFPNATFNFVGHSNGTYLLSRSLEEYPCCTFKHAVFAGSVVRRAYEWKQQLSSASGVSSVTAVLNYVATSDWVVAMFPRGLEWLRKFDLGGAGHLGFRQSNPVLGLYELHYVVGNHSAAIDESHWLNISDFVLEGQGSKFSKDVLNKALPVDKMYGIKHSYGVWFLGATAPIWPLVALGAMVVPVILFFWFGFNAATSLAAVSLTLVAIFWAFLAKFVVTKL